MASGFSKLPCFDVIMNDEIPSLDGFLDGFVKNVVRHVPHKKAMFHCRCGPVVTAENGRDRGVCSLLSF